MQKSSVLRGAIKCHKKRGLTAHLLRWEHKYRIWCVDIWTPLVGTSNCNGNCVSVGCVCGSCRYSNRGISENCTGIWALSGLWTWRSCICGFSFGGVFFWALGVCWRTPARGTAVNFVRSVSVVSLSELIRVVRRTKRIPVASTVKSRRWLGEIEGRESR